MDPTVTMLARITAAAGRQLTIQAVVPNSGLRLAAIAESATGIDTVDWTRLRGIVDWLRVHPDQTEEAITDPPPRTGELIIDNLLAAIAEKIADDAGRPRPPWTGCVPPLSQTWSPPGTPRMQAVEAASAPVQFSSRNLLIGAENLWRQT